MTRDDKMTNAKVLMQPKHDIALSQCIKLSQISFIGRKMNDLSIEREGETE